MPAVTAAAAKSRRFIVLLLWYWFRERDHHVVTLPSRRLLAKSRSGSYTPAVSLVDRMKALKKAKSSPDDHLASAGK
jgi:hypothetical protein